MRIKFGEIIDGVLRLRSDREIMADLRPQVGTYSDVVTVSNIDNTIWVEFHYVH